MINVNLELAAAKKINEILQEEFQNPNPTGFVRVFVQGGGCSGFQYGFSIEEKNEEDDFIVEQNGVKLLVDAMSAQYLQGASINYEESLEGSRFVVRNPNASSTCGCGSSFSI